MANRAHSTVDAYRNIPLLTGPENFRQWQDALDGFARRKNYVRIFKGTEAEPFRRPIPQSATHGSQQYHDIRPRDECAGDNPPDGPQQLNALPPNIPPKLDEDQMEKWGKWQARENPARAAIIETIAPALRSIIRDAWSAHDCLTALQTKFMSSSMDHKRAAKAKVVKMRLRENCTPQEMRDHLEDFCDNVYQLEQVGVAWDDFTRCDAFLNSLCHNTAELLQLKWSITCAALAKPEDFETLATTFSSLAEQHRLRWENDDPSCD